ncbi:hypothetical protein [Novosphingobium jiangmenense]|uniref:Uncharacterized protein n=1 Tax=Novosphingobium jiangmenense TaxID=2791981 RepID=A0ABS0HFF0_9SPHN|nr:hypothetical protein [Novosphingobium jiangmenense]MBF9150983.1 hypothetical protein [Novosphingobium jiangmenense]
MRYAEAFESLGYKLRSARQDWSAEKDDGVCITIWKRRLNWQDLSYDTREHKNSIADWSVKSGNKKRILHASRALIEFDGWIDAILISGEPGISYEDAQVWFPTEKQGRRWRVVYLDEETGHLRLEAQ